MSCGGGGGGVAWVSEWVWLSKLRWLGEPGMGRGGGGGGGCLPSELTQVGD